MKGRRFIPHILLLVGGLGYVLWSFVHHPFPALGENPLLDLVDYHTPNFYGWLMLWHYACPGVAVLLEGFLAPVRLEGRRRDFAPFAPPGGRFHPGRRPRPLSSERPITRSKRERSSTPPGSPSPSAGSIPEWPSSGLSAPAKPRLAQR